MMGPLFGGKRPTGQPPLCEPTSHRENQGRPHRKGVRANGSLGRNACQLPSGPGNLHRGARANWLLGVGDLYEGPGVK